MKYLPPPPRIKLLFIDARVAGNVTEISMASGILQIYQNGFASFLPSGSLTGFVAGHGGKCFYAMKGLVQLISEGMERSEVIVCWDCMETLVSLDLLIKEAFHMKESGLKLYCRSCSKFSSFKPYSEIRCSLCGISKANVVSVKDLCVATGVYSTFDKEISRKLLNHVNSSYPDDYLKTLSGFTITSISTLLNIFSSDSKKHDAFRDRIMEAMNGDIKIRIHTKNLQEV